MEGESIELECAGCKRCVQRNSVCNWAKVAMLRVDEVVSHTRSEFIDVTIVNAQGLVRNYGSILWLVRTKHKLVCEAYKVQKRVNSHNTSEPYEQP